MNTKFYEMVENNATPLRRYMVLCVRKELDFGHRLSISKQLEAITGIETVLTSTSPKSCWDTIGLRAFAVHPDYNTFADQLAKRMPDIAPLIIRYGYSPILYDEIIKRASPSDEMVPFWRWRKGFKIDTWNRWYEQGRGR